MVPASALKRVSKVIEETVQIDSTVAKNIAASWHAINMVEDALSRLDTGVASWRAGPAVQNAMAAIVADALRPEDKIAALGFQPYAWMRAVGTDASEILAIQLGKSLPQNVYADTAEGIAAALKAGGMQIIAIHAEDKTDWADVRAIAAAAVKAEASALIVVSAACDAPKGVAVDVLDNWTDCVRDVREAMAQVRNQGAIRIVAVADMDAASLEIAMMEAAGVTPQAWQDMVQKNADGAELALNIAYQAPVKSF